MIDDNCIHSSHLFITVSQILNSILQLPHCRANMYAIGATPPAFSGVKYIPWHSGHALTPILPVDIVDPH